MLTLAVLTELRVDTCTCLYGEPNCTAGLRLMILKATLEDQINVSDGESGGHAALASSWSADGQWQAMNGAGHKVGFQQLSTVATCTS